ncbi:hypothetical protein BKA70DRAFT_1484362 [Coprinopsis sp. MPI-PUGE-AT-0042]|nr:hypothetical protein BKA70DRAFT_1484362 [Coprinopsis sp. MPI-PUGE-AT-0042]
MGETDIIEIHDHDDFWDATQWIGVGKTWPTRNIPAELIKARDILFKIPDEIYASTLPAKTLPVSDFLAFSFPSQSDALGYSLTNPNSTWRFTADPPTTSIGAILQHRLPCREELAYLLSRRGQALLDGLTSVVDPRSEDPDERLPLWVIPLMDELSKLARYQKDWMKSRSWCDKEVERRMKKGDHATVGQLEEVIDMLSQLPWKSPMEFERGNTTTFDLSYFLGTNWLTDDHINMMIQTISKRLEESPAPKKTLVAPLAFSVAITNLNLKEGTKHALLDRYRKRVVDDKVNRLYFPLNVNNNHWVTGVIDFETSTVCYGDSLSNYWSTGVPRKFDAKLFRWLKQSFRRAFKSEDTLPRADQNDGYSCGIITANTIEHNVFGTPLWEDKTATRHRIQWFKTMFNEVMKRLDTIHNPIDMTEPDAIDPHLLSQLDAVTAMGDHNFPDLVELAVEELRKQLAPADSGSPHPSGPSDSDSNGSLSQSSEDSSFDDSSFDDSDDDGPHGQDRYRSGQESGTESDNTRPIKRLREGSSSPTPSDAPSLPRESASEDAPAAPPTPVPAPGPTSVKSRSAAKSKKLRESMKAGTHVLKSGSLAGWRAKIKEADPRVAFDNRKDRLWHARCSNCSKWIGAKEAGDSTRFRQHHSSCLEKSANGKAPGLKNVPTISSFFAPKSGGQPSRQRARKPAARAPCPGLTQKDDIRILRYLRLVSELGGGSRALHVIAKEKYGKKFSKLKKLEDITTVIQIQLHEQKWKNDHKNLRVLSTTCEKEVIESASGERHPCTSCANVYASHAFKVALNKKRCTDPTKLKYTPHRFRQGLLGKLYARYDGLQEILEAKNASSPCVRVAKAYLDGKLKGKEVFAGIISAMATQLDREERGVGMQNFQYDPAWEEMCQILRDVSPQAYESLSKHIRVPTGRSFRMKRAREPRFPMEIGEQTFQMVADQLNTLGYTGPNCPVGLSCDDTKLLSGFRLYHDKAEDCHYLVGGTEGKLRVADPEQVRKVLAENKDKKATKVRLWCLTLPMAKVTPIIVAALPISDSMSADDLFPLLVKILDGLAEKGIKVVSYACDGTETERAIERKLLELGELMVRVIKNPNSNRPDTTFRFVKYRNHVIAILQDSKHALKTLRNNLFSGARLLTLGNTYAAYRHIRQLAEEAGTPIHPRDVVKLDRQDDNAACRLFSATVLQYLLEHHLEDSLGEIVFLFVFGELIDAFQNRSLSHRERVKLVLRARYFLDTWDAHLDVTGYNKARHHLSREARDILDILIEGLLALIVIHRDYIDGISPLLPWLHSSESCEHTFGSARQLIKDFTYFDFILMVPRLRVKLREAVLYAHTSDPKARASGYNHTYFDDGGISYLTLAQFPCDDDFSDLAHEAAEESDSLSELLGIHATQVFLVKNLSSDARRTMAQSQQIQSPSLPAWYHQELVDIMDDTTPGDTWFEDRDSDDDQSDDEEGTTFGWSDRLRHLLQVDANAPVSRSNATEEKMERLTFAAMSTLTDEAMKVFQFSEMSSEEYEELLEQEHHHIRLLRQHLAQADSEARARATALQVSARPPMAPRQGPTKLQLDQLVSLRRQHETRQAALGVRTSKSAPSHVSDIERTKRKIAGEMIKILKDEQGERGVGTGIERWERWRSAAPGGRDGMVDGKLAPLPSAGNEANAVLTADALSKQAHTKRVNAFKKGNIAASALDIAKDALVTPLRALQLDDYGIIFTEDSILLGRVVTMYSKTAGKNGKHAAVSDTSLISAVSYLGLHVFQNRHRNSFTHVPDSAALVGTHLFTFIPPFQFLMVLPARAVMPQRDGSLLLDDAHMIYFHLFASQAIALNASLKQFKSRKRNEADTEMEVDH